MLFKLLVNRLRLDKGQEGTTVPVTSLATALPRKTALVVEEVDEMLDLLEIAAEGAGLKVIRASTPAEALAVFGSRVGEVDLLMTDVRVAGESGIEMAERMMTLKPSLQVLAVSVIAGDAKLVQRRGTIHFLRKPFSTSELRGKVEQMFQMTSPSVTLRVTGGNALRYSVAIDQGASRCSAEKG